MLSILAIWINMQQLNVLSINVPQNVETKDESSAFVSPSLKGQFSQHIDSHLAKNKDINQSENNARDKDVDARIGQDFTESSKLKADSQIQKKSDISQRLVDETASANQAQEVAASGKKDEKNPSKEKLNEDHQIIDDPELLMSFLTKADKTLVDENSAEGVKLGEMSAEQKAKYETQLLLASSDLVADLSNVAKAVSPNSEVAIADLAEQEKVANSLLASSKMSKTNTEINQVNATALTESNNVKSNSLENKNLEAESLISGSSVIGSKNKSGSKSLVESKPLENGSLVNDKGGKSSQNTESYDVGVDSDLLTNTKSILSQQLNADKLDKEGTGNNTAVDKSAQQLVKNEIKGKVLSQVDANSEKVLQKELNQQSMNSESGNIELRNIKIASKSPASVKAISSEQNPLDVESKLNDKIVKLVQGDNSIIKSEANLASAISVSQHTNHNKNLSTTNLGQKTTTEPVVKQGNLVEPEAQLSAKSVDHLIEQNNEFNVDENEGASAKVPTKANEKFSVNSNIREATSRATQISYDRVEQQAAEIFNPTGSAEVSQSQKTNTQLHQETIAIFRRDFADAVKDKVMLMISQKLQQFDITLDPPELGNMQVRVNLQGEQASVNFVVQNQQAKEALEQNMHKLRDLLADQGVDVGDANVEQQSQQSGNEANNEENTGNNHHNSITSTADSSDAIEHSLSARMLNSSSMGVDYYV